MVMPNDDLEKLLGGFAADTLTPDEKQRLYNTALQDQQLFNLFADEQALKELLTNPVVRERLLRSLQETTSTTDKGNLSWFGWFRRPAGLAWAGGLAAALFAVVLATTIYQESLNEAKRSAMSEQVIPSTPPAAELSVEKTATPEVKGSRVETQAKTKSTAPARKQVFTANASKPETAVTTKPHEEQAAPPSPPQPSPRSEAQVSSSADQDYESTPSASTSTAALTKVPTTESPPAQVGSALSARSLFYGKSQEVASSAMTDNQQGRHSAPQFDRFTRKSERAENLRGTVAETTKPLGIRYSLVANGVKDPPDDRDAGTSLRTGSLDLMIESNQDSFFQVWGEADTIQAHLLFPFSAEDPVSSQLMAHQRRRIPILGGYRSITVRLSRLPFDPLSTQAPNAIKLSTLTHLRESSVSMGPSGSHEQETYVVNQDPTAGTFAVRIPMPKL